MRKITRIAFLREYIGHPENLIYSLDEVAAKGYTRVAFYAQINTIPLILELVKEASKRNLEVCLFTGYIKYQEKYLSQHPDQVMCLSEEAEDQDRRYVYWGCPFNIDFKERYFNFLRELAHCPEVVEVWVNDEACMGFKDNCFGCFCETCQADFREKFNAEIPRNPDWESLLWKKFLKWRFQRWNDIHSEMKKVLNQVNPVIRTVFLSSPSVEFSGKDSWITGVDLAGMAERIDGLCADPYYTFHDLASAFQPREVYLSEWCKFLAGIMPEGKSAEIVPQGFSHTTFIRPLGEEDGYWSSLIPLATGIDYVAPFAYSFQKNSPVQQTYEKCFEFDDYFERNEPIKYAALIHGFASETYWYPSQRKKDESYDLQHLLPCADSLRQKGIAYQYYPDIQLEKNTLNDFPVLVLPDITCLSRKQATNIKSFWENGGGIVVTGKFGLHDEIGNNNDSELLKNLFGVEIIEKSGTSRRFELHASHEIRDGVIVDDEVFEHFSEGLCKPQLSLNNTLGIAASENAAIIARFEDGSPAVVIPEIKPGHGRLVYFAGTPTRVVFKEEYKINVQNPAHKLFSNAVEWAAGKKCEFRVEEWPPKVPMNTLRPCDARLGSTFEFFPLKGERSFLGLVTSYFKEPAEFNLSLDLPDGRKLKCVRELISKKAVAWKMNGGTAKIKVIAGYNTPALLYLFELH